MTDQEKNDVNRREIMSLIAYLMFVTAMSVYSMIAFWPHTTNLGNASSDVYYIIGTYTIHDEIRLLILVTCAGALGSIVHALRSFVWYVGNRKLERNWIPSYILRPFIGAVIGVVFYLVIRGGFYSPENTSGQSNPFIFIALACITGMFSEQAISKLKEVAEALLTKPETVRTPKKE